MKKALLFTKRNLIEMMRDPMVYIFCVGFPLVMMLLFSIINHYLSQSQIIFELNSLVPGLLMFSYTFLMLMTGLLISKDRTTSFLKRLYTSPLKGYQYIIGYFIPFLCVGIGQDIITISGAYIISLIMGQSFTNFGNVILLCIEMIPMMIFSIFLGITFGLILNDKAAPGVTSIFISAAGILGGAWMPVDTMGGFENFVSYLPFYPSVYLGRIITGAYHTIPDSNGNMLLYSFSEKGLSYIIIYLLYTVLACVLSLLIFRKRMNSDN